MVIDMSIITTKVKFLTSDFQSAITILCFCFEDRIYIESIMNQKVICNDELFFSNFQNIKSKNRLFELENCLYSFLEKNFKNEQIGTPNFVSRLMPFSMLSSNSKRLYGSNFRCKAFSGKTQPDIYYLDYQDIEQIIKEEYARNEFSQARLRILNVEPTLKEVESEKEWGSWG